MANLQDGAERLIPPAVRSGLLGILAYLSEPVINLPEDIDEAREVVGSWVETTSRAAPAFPTGSLVATAGVVSVVPPDEMMVGLGRHVTGDWGNVDAHDWRSNDLSVKEGTRILSSYRSDAGVVFWIITEGDRSITTFLLPDEY